MWKITNKVIAETKVRQTGGQMQRATDTLPEFKGRYTACSS